ncbi:hypothetical protein M422DRAFT_275964 [Sphaerobolus stellatus SS14]|uniref:Uncharacterized protein n=1 Tax=Sphaerobolus stellatus (strain SS14) TaxID=990650 RepID=A0A0C9T3J8_SPHS4|nr:hypothetical protein M422DRAFT_275964 [Sphaerobolus stellatus SS14]
MSGLTEITQSSTSTCYINRISPELLCAVFEHAASASVPLDDWAMNHRHLHNSFAALELSHTPHLSGVSSHEATEYFGRKLNLAVQLVLFGQDSKSG